MDILTAPFSAAKRASLFSASYLNSLFAASPAGFAVVGFAVVLLLAGVFLCGEEARDNERRSGGEKLA